MSYPLRRKSKPGPKRCTEPTYTVKNLPSQRRKRTIAYNRISKALEIGNLANTDESKIELFLSYCQEVKNIANSFEEAHFIILDLLEDDADDKENEMQECFDEIYFEVIAIQRKFQQRTSSQTENSKPNLLTDAHGGNMRLPKIALPMFSGSIKEWPEFISTYDTLIHNSTLLSEIEKFHYLVSVLRGEALLLIRTFPVACEHYLSAYEALRSRYEDKRELAFTCWRDILDVSFKTTNAQDFRHALDTIDENLTILKKLKLPTEHWDFVICYNIMSKLDSKLRCEFEEKHTDIELPQYKYLKAFLHSKSEALIRDTHFTAVNDKTANTEKAASIASPRLNRRNVTHSLIAPTVTYPMKRSDRQGRISTEVSATPKFVRKCSFCEGEHHISACKAFLEKSVDERMGVASERRWCYNCLTPSHVVRECNSIFLCQKCKRKHHTLLHRDQAANSSDSSDNQSNSVALVVANESLAPSNPSFNTTVLLATAVIKIRNAYGEFHTFRALFDSGSQNNFLTLRAAQQLNLDPKVACANVQGLGSTPASISGIVTCDVAANHDAKLRLEMLVIPNICGDQPTARLNTSGWDEIKTLPLADPGFDIPGPIDVLLGADVFAESLLEERLKGNASQPRAFNSVFGWLLLGKSRLASSCLLGVVPPNEDDTLNNIVQRFREIDNVPPYSRLTSEEERCESCFIKDHYRDQAGRHIVCLPFKDNTEPVFEGSRAIALRRFHAIERRLTRDSALKQQYTEFMTDCIESGHMSVVPAEQLGQGQYYIPHRCVVRPDIATTKLRVVFDASAKDANSRSLNDSQLTGTKLQSNIIEILLHYRELMADVRQMYRQINLAPHHRDYQRILWRAHSDEPLQEYVLNTVMYRIFSSAILACRTIQHLANHIQEMIPTECWRHVSSTVNPAYICSRGQLPAELLNNVLWWAGPEWLSQSKFQWPKDISKFKIQDNVVLSEQCRTIALATDPAVPIEQASHAERITFKRIPLSAPHFGGVWEIQIKAAKSHLYRIIGDQTLTFEELATLFTQNESILNSRPLCPLSSDPNALNVLTPGHFPTREPLTAILDPDYTDVNINRLNRWQLIQSFKQQFWKRWEHEYLHALIQRAKWIENSTPLAVNSIVLIKDDNRAPLQWALGRVVSLHPGCDGVVRVAKVKTAKDHLIKRPLLKLCPLPSA